jgi:chromosomal replication initiator protein
LPAHLELTPAWRDVSAELRRAVGDSTFDIWLARLEPKAWDGAVLVLDAPPATRSWVADRFGRVLERCTRAVLGAEARVAFAGEAAQAARAALGGAMPGAEALERFIPRYTFDQFIIGDGNRLAHAAALAVAEDPGQAHNPLFLHARPGLGKTHLLHAIGNYITAYTPGTTVRYTTAEAFTNGFITALAGRDLDRFKHLYRDVDVLLIDDVQFLASKAKTEEEFFHTFNAVRDTGRQLVLTCDRLPRHMPGIAQRLRDRFESGLVTEIATPDRATRLAVLRKRAALDRVAVPDQSVIDLIADRITDNIRALEGALIRVVAHHSLTGRPIDLALAKTVLDEIHPAVGGAGRELTPERIQEVVAHHFDLTVAELVSQSREARVAWPRQVALHLSRTLTDAPLQELGRRFGGRNHATVLHACKRVSERIAHSPEDAATVDAISQELTQSGDDRTS